MGILLKGKSMQFTYLVFKLYNSPIYDTAYSSGSGTMLFSVQKNLAFTSGELYNLNRIVKTSIQRHLCMVSWKHSKRR